MSDRLKRKDIKHDKFVDEMGTVYSSIRTNWSRLLGLAVGLIVLLGVIMAVFAWRNRQEASAQDKLASAIETIETRVGDPATPTTGANQFKTEAEKNAKAEQQFKEVVEKFDGSDAAGVAGIYLARLEAARGDVPAATKRLRDFLAEHPDHLLAGGVKLSLYEMDLASGDAKKVIGEMEKELSSSKGPIPTESLLSLLARAYEITGDQAKAKDAYRRLTTEFPDSPYALDAQRKVAI